MPDLKYIITTIDSLARCNSRAILRYCLIPGSYPVGKVGWDLDDSVRSRFRWGESPAPTDVSSARENCVFWRFHLPRAFTISEDTATGSAASIMGCYMSNVYLQDETDVGNWPIGKSINERGRLQLVVVITSIWRRTTQCCLQQ